MWGLAIFEGPFGCFWTLFGPLKVELVIGPKSPKFDMGSNEFPFPKK